MLVEQRLPTPVLTQLHSPYRIRERRVIALNVMLLAFVVRLLWVLRVQSPFAAMYSDMGAYVYRAEQLLAGTQPSEPRILALWPWGTHVIVAAELAVFHHAQRPISVFHALVGAIPAGCAVLLTARFTNSRIAMACAGIAVALWHPHIIFSGYFSSELWYTSFLWIFTIGLICHTEGSGVWAALTAGLALSVLFVVRPQILLTCVLVGVAILVFRWRPNFRPLKWNWAALLIPLFIAIAVSSIRLHRLTGRYGLISANQSLVTVFAETDVDKLEATWVAANGVPQTYWFNPHTKHPIVIVVQMNGFIADPDLLDKIRKEHLRGVPWTARLKRTAGNVGLLALNNLPWPEDDYRDDPLRGPLQRAFGRITLAMFPFVIFGLFCLRRHVAGQILVWANLATVIIVAALYLGEARYRVPYDTFAIVAAITGLHTIWRYAVKDWQGIQSDEPTPRS